MDVSLVSRAIPTMLLNWAWSVVSLSMLWFVSFGKCCAECENDIVVTTPGHGAARKLQFFFGMFTTTIGAWVPPTTTPGGGGGVVTTTGVKDLADVVTVLTFDEMYEALAGTDPTPSEIGPGWNNLNIVYILQYFSKPDPWLETIWGQMITGVAALLAVVYVVVLLYAVYTVGYRRLDPRRVPNKKESGTIPKKPNVSKGSVDPIITSIPSVPNGQSGPEVQSNPSGPKRRKVRITEVSPGPPDYMDNAWRGRELPPPHYENIAMASTRVTTAYPPSPVQDDIPDPLMYGPVYTPRNSTPSEIIIRANDAVYGGTEVDPVTGRENDYYTTTKFY